MLLFYAWLGALLGRTLTGATSRRTPIILCAPLSGILRVHYGVSASSSWRIPAVSSFVRVSGAMLKTDVGDSSSKADLVDHISLG